ncbi:glycosyltransferase [Candidatus Parcubacteria bacterium]|nr:glycosyltransferase [Candidatus Parcubacteria bacterium]
MKAKLFLIFHGRFPGEKAASLFAAKSAEAFADAGLDVRVLVPKRKGVVGQDAYEYFGVKRNFTIVDIPTTGLSNIFKKISFWLSYRTFAKGVKAHLMAHAGPADIIYSNETLPLYAASSISKNIFYEMHDFPESKLALFARFLGRVKWMLVHNRWKVEKIGKTFDFPANGMMCEPNAVDIDAFDLPIAQNDAREKLGLPHDKKIAVYTGHLYGWKGVDTLAKAADLLSSEFLVVFVGGTAADVSRFREKYGKFERVMIVGHKPHKEIPLWQKAADILILPNSAKENISAFYTSPMKLFEYMASRKPIVASDIPSIREIVDESSAFLVAPDDSAALAGGILLAANDKETAKARAEKARSLVEDHSWSKRARRILDFIEAHP